MLACVREQQFDRILEIFESRDVETTMNLSVYDRDNFIQTSYYRNHAISCADYLIQSQYHTYFIGLAI